jgi:hypothetical protein
MSQTSLSPPLIKFVQLKRFIHSEEIVVTFIAYVNRQCDFWLAVCSAADRVHLNVQNLRHLWFWNVQAGSWENVDFCKKFYSIINPFDLKSHSTPHEDGCLQVPEVRSPFIFQNWLCRFYTNPYQCMLKVMSLVDWVDSISSSVKQE